MNRKEEFEVMLEQLRTPVPALETTLERAREKRKRQLTRMILRPAAALAACFALFVLLVNFCAPVAYACARIPVLRELAAAVTFSRSLTDAVQNEYVQTMALSRTENGVTAEISYLIVDQKQVNVFYRLDSNDHEKLYADPEVLSADGSRPESCSYHSTGFDAENGELRCLSIDFVDNDVPDRLTIRLSVYPNITREEAAPVDSTNQIFDDDPYDPPDYLAEFEFPLEFDPKFTASGKVFPVNRTVTLEGQAITITEIQVYPTHMRVDIAEAPDNTAWLKGLEFYVETDWGMQFEAASSGIISTGSEDSPSMVSYRADSSYFYEAEHLKLVITGAQWLRKDMETTYLNLVTGEHGPLPQGTAFESAQRTGKDWIVTFRSDTLEGDTMYQLFGHEFYGPQGEKYEIQQWSHTFGDRDETGQMLFFRNEFPLKNYPYEEVWLSPQFSHYWEAEDRITIPIQ